MRRDHQEYHRFAMQFRSVLYATYFRLLFLLRLGFVHVAEASERKPRFAVPVIEPGRCRGPLFQRSFSDRQPTALEGRIT